MFQFNRYIFTQERTIMEKFYDYALALVIAALLLVGLLSYFDVLTP